MNRYPFVQVAEDLEFAGLLWRPEIGDEVSNRVEPASVSILVDPQGMSPSELRSVYLWLPTVEQLVFQFEARQAILYHAGLELTDSSFCYKAVIKAPERAIEGKASSLREAMGIALRDLLLLAKPENLH
jgi:hypothetical protein